MTMKASSLNTFSYLMAVGRLFSLPLVLSVVTPSTLLAESTPNKSPQSTLHGAGPAIDGTNFTCTLEREPDSITCRTAALDTLEGTQYFTLEDPDRLVIDIPRGKIRRHETRPITDSDVAQRVRSGQRGEAARVVFDLKKQMTISHYASPDKKSITFSLTPVTVKPLITPQGVAAQPSPPAVTTPTPPQPSATPTAKVDTEDKLSILTPKLPPVTISFEKEKLNPESLLLFSVDSTFISFEPGERPVRDIQVINKTEQELFLRTDTQRVFESGTPQERYENTKTVLATPRRFTLPPLGKRTIRTILAGKLPDEGEEIYRVIISPEQVSALDVEVPGEVNQQAATFKVVAGLGITLTVPSNTAKGIVEIESGVNQVILKNTGTRAVFVENCSSCPLTKEVCTSSDRKVLYPDRPWSIPVVGSGAITCEMSVGKEKQSVSTMYGAKQPK